MAKEIKMNEFRKGNKKTNLEHPTYIYARVGNEYKFIGITHAEITEGIDNIPLDVNPEPGNKSKAFAKSIVEQANRSSFSKKLKGWKFADSDKEKIKLIINKEKK